jgi:hypothetical protein
MTLFKPMRFHFLREYREAFSQYVVRYGLPLPKPTSELRLGDLCVFKSDGTLVKVGSVYDGKPAYVKITETPDPIVSNGMRCRTLTDEEREKYTLHEDDTD